MPRKRQIDPAFFSDEKMVALSIEAAFLYEGLWCWADDQANIEGSASQWRLWVFPGREVTVEQVTGWQEDLVAARRIFPYSVNGSNYYHIPNLLKHQKIQYPSKPRCPSPPDDILNEPSVSPHKNLTESIKKPKRVQSSRVQSSRVQSSRVQSKDSGKPPSSSPENGEENPVRETMRLHELERGYPPGKYAQEAAAAKVMIGQGHTPEVIIECWKQMKLEKFYQDKELFLNTVQGQIGNWAKGGSHGTNRGHTGSHERYSTTEELKASLGQPLD